LAIGNCRLEDTEEVNLKSANRQWDRPTGYRLVVLTALRCEPIGTRQSPIGNLVIE